MRIKALTANRLVPLFVASAPLFGCATAQAPKELVDARAAYTHAETSSYAKDLSPASLHEAKVSLDHAETMFQEEGDDPITRDTAYIAIRKAQLAEANGQTQHIQRELEAAKEREGQAQAKAMVATQAELERTRAQLEQEKSARALAEQKSNEALERLAAANAANVKHESRGTVITLSGNVLFASGKSQLLPGAQSGLSQIAEALKAQNDTTLLVEGHTDSTGNDATNQALSKARAEAVQSYLVSRGFPAQRITAVGLGSSRPVADNKTPEGRANNRRVEIVVHQNEPR
jgi:outer membrane protein OmpA-like peptidoglycan-associated protein